jgi:hypothetical protein
MKDGLNFGRSNSLTAFLEVQFAKLSMFGRQHPNKCDSFLKVRSFGRES